MDGREWTFLNQGYPVKSQQLLRSVAIKVGFVFKIFFMAAFAGFATAQEPVSFSTSDGGMIFGTLYGTGNRGVVLAHGGRFNKESWAKQARVLEMAGFRVLAFDFRGYGQSRGPGSLTL